MIFMPFIVKRSFAALLLLPCLAMAETSTEQSTLQPNILFIAVDDMRPLTGSYGNKMVITPHIDALANQSTQFNKAYVSWPVCGPSRMSLMTGQRPEENGIINLKLKIREVNPDIVTLPQLLKNNGYVTAAVGKIFDPRNVESRAKDDPVSWTIPYQTPKASLKGKDRLAVKSIDAKTEKFVDGNINNRGKKLLTQMAKNDKPFFLAVGYKRPHLPFIAPKKYFDLYDRSAFALASFQQTPKNSNAKYILNNNGEMLTYRPTPKAGEKIIPYPKGKFSEEHQRELLHGYYATMAFVDSLVGELLETLEKTGEADNTIIVFWGDHGFHLGDHGMWGKHTTMEQANRIPLMIKLPNGAIGQFNKPVETLDLYPTLAELAQVKTTQTMHGQSLVAILKDHSASLEKEIAISQYKRGGAFGYSLRTNQYRYTEWIDKNKKVVYRDLFDLDEDPLETLNIAEKKEIQSIVNELAKVLRENKAGLKRL
jgi:iduronate 2-sulfatase